MSLTLDSSRYPVQPIARKSTNLGSISKSGGTPQPSIASTPLPVTPVSEVSIDLEYRAERLRGQYYSNDQISSRSQQAIQSYRSIKETEERTRVSELFGLNEYA